MSNSLETLLEAQSSTSAPTPIAASAPVVDSAPAESSATPTPAAFHPESTVKSIYTKAHQDGALAYAPAPYFNDSSSSSDTQTANNNTGLLPLPLPLPATTLSPSPYNRRYHSSADSHQQHQHQQQQQHQRHFHHGQQSPKYDQRPYGQTYTPQYRSIHPVRRRYDADVGEESNRPEPQLQLNGSEQKRARFAPTENLSPAIQKPVMNYTAKEIEWRRKQLASSLSVYDRKKFEREFDVASLHLSQSQRIIWDQNPHLRQVFANKRQLSIRDTALTERDRYLHSEFPRTPYHRRQGEAKTVDHWGQRKLLMSEIEFLTLFARDGLTVVYAGAAPGTHTNYLAKELFPTLKFVLVDPAPFRAVETDMIKIRQEYFTDAIAQEFAGRSDILFVCDIRAWSKAMTDAEREAQVIVDMKWQEDWVRIIKPIASMLKFRLPYSKGTSEYLDGKIYLPVWGGRTTTESRLVVTDSDSKRVYDHTDYESAMFHFNTVFRTTLFPQDVQGEGLDHCFDCASEVLILREYLLKIQKESEATLTSSIVRMSKEMSRLISTSGRTLALCEHEDDED